MAILKYERCRENEACVQELFVCFLEWLAMWGYVYGTMCERTSSANAGTSLASALDDLFKSSTWRRTRTVPFASTGEKMTRTVCNRQRVCRLHKLERKSQTSRALLRGSARQFVASGLGGVPAHLHFIGLYLI